MTSGMRQGAGLCHGTWILLWCVLALNVHARPDLSGTWNTGSLTPLQRPLHLGDQTHFTAEEAAEFTHNFDAYIDRLFKEEDGEEFVGYDLWLNFGDQLEPDLRTSRIVHPANGRIPDLTEAAEAREADLETLRETMAGPEVLDFGERCIAGDIAILRGPDSNIMSLVQTSGELGVFFEFNNQVRIIPFDNSPLPPAHLRFWRGASSGRWDGETLVVTTANIRPEYSLAGSGTGLVLEETFQLEQPDLLRYEVTIRDPESFTASWTIRSHFRRTDKKRYEFACHEGNGRNMQGMLKGARVLEQEGAAQTAEE